MLGQDSQVADTCGVHTLVWSRPPEVLAGDTCPDVPPHLGGPPSQEQNLPQPRGALLPAATRRRAGAKPEPRPQAGILPSPSPPGAAGRLAAPPKAPVL